MNSQSQGRYALVTGGNQGIGFAICQGLLAAGFKVSLAARSRDNAKVAAEQLHDNSKVRVVTEASPSFSGKLFYNRQEVSY